MSFDNENNFPLSALDRRVAKIINVVGRLLNLDNEMKEVLSICDISCDSVNQSKTQRKAVNKHSVRSSSTMNDRKSDSTCKDEKPHFNSIKEMETNERCHVNDKFHSGMLRRKFPVEKPNSAPPGVLSTITEVVECHPKRKRSLRNIQLNSRKGEMAKAVESSEWLKYSPEINERHEAEAEQPLRPPEEILADISQYGNDNYFAKRSTIWCSTCRRRSFDCICRCKRGSKPSSGGSNWQPEDADDDDDAKESFIHHIKPDLQENTIIKELVRKMEKKEMESLSSQNCHGKIKSYHSESEHSKFEKGESQCMKMCRQVPRSESQGRSISKRPVTAPVRTRGSQNVSTSRCETRRQNRWNGNTKAENDTGKLDELSQGQSNPQNMIKSYNCNNAGEFGNNGKNEGDTWEEDAVTIGDQQDSASDTESSIDTAPPQDDTDLRKKRHLSDATTRKIADIIEKNHEKIEEMRRSKSLALDKVKYMKEKYDTLAEIKNEMAEKLQQLIAKNDMLVKELKEADESKKQVIEELKKYKQSDSSSLLNRLRCANTENEQCRQKIQILEHQLRKTCWSDQNTSDADLKEKNLAVPQNQDKCYEYHVLFRRQEAAYRKLVQGIAVVEKVIRNNKEKEKRLAEIKVQLKRRATKTQCFFERLSADKMELMQTVNELQGFMEESRIKINYLEGEISKKNEELEKQKKLLLEKSENLEDTNRELESIRKNSVDLEDQVKMLRKSIENFDQMHQNLLKERQSFEELVQRVQGENTKLHEQLSNERDSILIKNKIIEDQQETIKQLRDKSEEMKTMVRKIQSLERLVNIERDEKLELQDIIERLRWKKDELKQRVKSLEADLLLAPQEVVRDLQKTQIVLQELENQVQIKQREWEILLQSLAKEKEEACNVAAFATKKLIQTTSDFQKQSDAQKKLYKILTENIEKKRRPHDSSEKRVNVRFSENLDQQMQENEELYDEHMRIMQRFRCHPKQAGILKNGKGNYTDSNGSIQRQQCLSSINLKENRGEPYGEENEHSESDSEEILERYNIEM